MTGEELKNLRQSFGLTRPELAERLAVPVGRIDVWENAEIAMADSPRVLELAMDQVEYEMNRIPDAEYDALIARAKKEIQKPLPRLMIRAV